MSQDIICRDSRNAHILFSNLLFLKASRLLNNVEKHCRPGQATGDNVAHAHCMLDN